MFQKDKLDDSPERLNTYSEFGGGSPLKKSASTFSFVKPLPTQPTYNSSILSTSKSSATLLHKLLTPTKQIHNSNSTNNSPSQPFKVLQQNIPKPVHPVRHQGPSELEEIPVSPIMTANNHPVKSFSTKQLYITQVEMIKNNTQSNLNRSLKYAKYENSAKIENKNPKVILPSQKFHGSLLEKNRFAQRLFYEPPKKSFTFRDRSNRKSFFDNPDKKTNSFDTRNFRDAY